MGLAEYLKMGVGGAMGIEPIIQKRRTEAEQLGAAMTKSADTTANAQINAANTEAQATIGAAKTRAAGQDALWGGIKEGVGSLASAITKKEAAKGKALSDKELLKIKHDYDMELERLRLSGAAAAKGVKSEDTLLLQTNTISDKAQKAIQNYNSVNKDTGVRKLGPAGVLDELDVISKQALDYKLSDNQTIKGIKDSLIATVANDPTVNIEDLKSHAVFKSDPNAYQKALTLNMENKVGEKAYGGTWWKFNSDAKTVHKEQLSQAFRDYAKQSGISPATVTNQDYIDFLKKAENGDKDVVGIISKYASGD